MIVDEQLFRLLKTNTLFRGVSLTMLKPFFKPKNFIHVKEGEIIYNSDSDATELYLVVEGEAKLKFCQERRIEIKYILDFFGEVEILKNCKRISFAVANVDSTLYRISSSEILLLSETDEVVNRNLKKLNVVKDSENQAGENKLNEILGNVNQDLVDKNDIDKVELDNEAQNKILSDQELESILEKQKSIKEIHTVLTKITNVPNIEELGLEE